jgi:septum formation protein
VLPCDLNKDDWTIRAQAVEVYKRLTLASPDDPPDLVISADTVVLLDGAILEKPGTKSANLVMLLDLNARVHDVVTGPSHRDTPSSEFFSKS